MLAAKMILKPNEPAENGERALAPSAPTRLSLRFEFRFFILLLLSFAIYFIASTLGSGWALLMCSAQLCFCLLSCVLPGLTLKSLRAEISGPDTIGAGDKIQIVVQLGGKSALGFLRRFLILQVVPSEKILYEPESKLLKTESSVSRAVAKVLYEQMPLSAVSLECPGLKRGIRQLPPIAVETSFPFGLVGCIALFYSRTRLAVLPRMIPIDEQFLFRLRSGSYVAGESRGLSTGLQNSSSSRGVREYRRGDSRRHIHWSTSARHGSLMVREFEKEGLPSYDLVFDLSSGWNNPEQFELAISASASILQLGHSLGIHPQISFLDGGSVRRLSGNTTDIDEQMLLLAALDFNDDCQKMGNSKCPMSNEEKARFFQASQQAVILVTAFLPSGASVPNALLDDSRNSVYTISVSASSELKPSHEQENEFVLAKIEDLANL